MILDCIGFALVLSVICTLLLDLKVLCHLLNELRYRTVCSSYDKNA